MVDKKSNSYYNIISYSLNCKENVNLACVNTSRISPGGKKNMTKYEMLYILDNALSDEAKDGIIKKIEDLVVENGGVIEKTDRWGARKLQYPINYKSEGYYVLTTFEAEKSLVVEIKRIVGITDGIIRRLITKI